MEPGASASPVGPVLGVDLGSVRVGLALSDTLGRIAHPLGVIPRTGRDALIAELREQARRHAVVGIVVGVAVPIDGGEDEATRATRRLVRRLARSTGLPVAEQDEQGSTREAHRAMIEEGRSRRRRDAVVDAVAATVILQSWLDTRTEPT